MKKVILIATALALFSSCSKETLQDANDHPLKSSSTHVCTPDNFNGEIAFPGEEGIPMEITMKDGSIFEYQKHGDVNIIEGDIAVSGEQLELISQIDQTSNAEGAGLSWWDRVFGGKKWSNKTLYYRISSGVSSSIRTKIYQAVNEINSQTSVTIRYRTNQSNYVNIIPSSGCWSYVGKQGGSQNMGLATWCSKGNVIHEFLHAFGVYHEQSRGDRDNHITVNYGNIQSGKSGNFAKKGSRWSSFNLNSIMMYGSYAFSKNGQPTITRKNGTTFSTQRSYISYTDKATLNGIY